MRKLTARIVPLLLIAFLLGTASVGGGHVPSAMAGTVGAMASEVPMSDCGGCAGETAPAACAVHCASPCTSMMAIASETTDAEMRPGGSKVEPSAGMWRVGGGPLVDPSPPRTSLLS